MSEANSHTIKLSHVGKVILVMLILFTGAFFELKFNFLERYTNLGRAVATQNSSELARIVNEDKPRDRSNVDFKIFWEVWNLLESEYVDQEALDAKKMVDGATSGMTAALGDPYTMYLPPKENERSGQDLAGSFYGVGIELGYIDGVLAAIAPLEGTPAQKAGVQAGDLIIRVKDKEKNIDEDSSTWPLDKAVDVIRGPKGSIVTLTVVRKGLDKPLDIDIARGEIIVKSAELKFVEYNGKKVAHIKLSRFGERTNGEWDDIVDNILVEKNNIAGIVLDMRNNPGGFFDGAIDVASEFIKDGVIVSQKDKVSQEDFKSTGRARLAGIPVEVLVNKGSASASEIVAGALRDRLGSKLIGEKTFGKGTVQDRRELSNGGGIHITISKWLLPAGAWIHKEGIPVDVEVQGNPDTPEDEQLLKAIEVL